MPNPFVIAKRISKKIKIKAYTGYFYIGALAEYWTSPHGWRGGYKSRLRELSAHTERNPEKIAIFVGFADSLTLSTRAYLETLRAAGYEILYISNRRINHCTSLELSTICWRVFERLNLGRDFGAFKDGILWAHDNQYLNECSTLLIANDSMQFIPGQNAEALVASLDEFERSEDDALFSHISYFYDVHYQSYFQALKTKVFNSTCFINFWKKYIPLSHRGHCIFSGEIALSQRVYSKIKKTRVLYSSVGLIAHLKAEQSKDRMPTARSILRAMPSPIRTLQRSKGNYMISHIFHKAEENEYLHEHDLCFISELIENGNPSHIAAFLFPFFLNCPLIKQDLCSAGSFSIAHAAHLFKEALEKSTTHDRFRHIKIDDYVKEFVDMLNHKGTPLSHMNKPKESAHKGITGGFIYPKVYNGSV